MSVLSLARALSHGHEHPSWDPRNGERLVAAARVALALAPGELWVELRWDLGLTFLHLLPSVWTSGRLHPGAGQHPPAARRCGEIGRGTPQLMVELALLRGVEELLDRTPRLLLRVPAAPLDRTPHLLERVPAAPRGEGAPTTEPWRPTRGGAWRARVTGACSKLGRGETHGS